ncbi:protein enabled homolog [Gossypium hirsutum]|uniref:Protein enabled homolog n=1 Tax=Gossypium hirsutum TaxID=3635 RepID=A0A1U8KN24_GOSHI|nr:protein enabled homolog [Gossypium hirsutum]
MVIYPRITTLPSLSLFPTIPPPITSAFNFLQTSPPLPSPPLPPILSSPSSPPPLPPSPLLLLCSLHQIGVVTFVAYEFTLDREFQTSRK